MLASLGQHGDLQKFIKEVSLLNLLDGDKNFALWHGFIRVFVLAFLSISLIAEGSDISDFGSFDDSILLLLVLDLELDSRVASERDVE